MPSVLAASAAWIGESFPELFEPSVSKMIIRDLVSFRLSSRIADAESAEPIAVPWERASLGRTLSILLNSQSCSSVIGDS